MHLLVCNPNAVFIAEVVEICLFSSTLRNEVI